MRKAILATALALTTTALAATATTTSNVTLRAKPSTSSQSLGIVPNGTTLTVACEGNWCRTTYKGRGGYVSKAYVRAMTASPALAVPVVPAPAPSGGSDVYYANCTAARAAGAAPIYRGEPGYRSRLDRDNDGVACE